MKWIGRLLIKVGNVLVAVANRFFLASENQYFYAWLKDNGDKTLRLEYDINHNSLVVDLGGYEGQWTSDIFSMYQCRVLVFEPVQCFAKAIQNRFNLNDKISVFSFGLSAKDEEITISLDQNASSAFKQGINTEAVKLFAANDFFIEHGIKRIDLIKINIEGAEYDLLDHLIETDFIRNIVNIQVQFHNFVPDARRRMANIHQQLLKTHHLTYQYPYVWENWRLNSSTLADQADS